MALNINGTTGISGVDGSVSAPALTGTDSNTGITFPAADTIKFSSNGVERMSITNSGVTGAGIVKSYALLADVKSNGTASGTFTSGAYRTRDLNTEISDTDGIVSISSNQFTLQAGTYFIAWSAPAAQIQIHKTKLYNVTDSSTVQLGENAYPRDTTANHSRGSAKVTIASAKTFEIQHRCSSTVSGDGFGITASFGDDEIFTRVEIFKTD